MKSVFTLFLLTVWTHIIFSQNIGIETTNPKSKLHLAAGDIFLQNSTQGIILKSPDGNCWKLGVTNSGLSMFTSVSCPDAWQCGDVLNHGGEDYNTVLIGSQCWMAENLNVGTMINGTTNMTNNSVIEKYCYNNDAANCTTYGGLYQWDEMMQYSTTAGAQGICPTGWHLPTDAEWTTLENALPAPDKGSRLAGNGALWYDGALDQSTYFATSGFATLPAASRLTSGSFSGNSYDATFWSSSETGSGDVWIRYILYDFTSINFGIYGKAVGFPVRCVQD